ncbi:DUF58 domain-containing protein [Bacillus rubiinfantis]|uniref:DUF58 domain-containing protein n=1 Tax=Bacillus rubiinfantis TaxID=1499680 RepID=UPI0005A61F9D|nr:DUF58 domain-containing protein [Bacillus rubiinfantis]
MNGKLVTYCKKLWKYILLIVLITLTFSYAMFQGGFVSWFLFYSFLPFALYCLVLSVYPLGEFEISRVFQKTDYQAGESLTVMITISRSKPFPLFYLLIEDHAPDTLACPQDFNFFKTILFPGFKKQISFEYSILELPRGEHVFQGVTIRTGDPLGLFEKEKQFVSGGRIIVYPAYTELIYRPYDNQFDQGLTASRERVQRDTSMVVGVREYQPGDRFSWINWKAMAKRNEVMTKEFEQRQSHDVLVVMNTTHHQHFETVVSFTASLLRAVLKKGAQAGLVTQGQEWSTFPIRGGEQHLQQLFYHLAKVKASQYGTFENVFEAEGFLRQQSVSLMLITPQLTKALLDKASFFKQRKGTVTIFLIKNQQELPTAEERSLRSMANARGIRIVMVHEGNFTAAFAEVKG